jgi:hypothetical protein
VRSTWIESSLLLGEGNGGVPDGVHLIGRECEVSDLSVGLEDCSSLGLVNVAGQAGRIHLASFFHNMIPILQFNLITALIKSAWVEFGEDFLCLPL